MRMRIMRRAGTMKRCLKWPSSSTSTTACIIVISHIIRLLPAFLYMAIKTILLPIRESDTSDSLMESALCLAIHNQAHLDLLYVQRDTEQLIPFATMGLTSSMRQSIVDSATTVAVEEIEKLEQRFHTLCEKHEVKRRSRGTDSGKPSADFLVRSGTRDELIGKIGRLADLIVVPQPVPARKPPGSLRAALLETGRPVLVMPRNKVWDRPAQRVAIGWNNSKEAAQAMTAALPSLQAAEQVFVLSSEKRIQQMPSADEACVYLQCQGVTAETVIIDATGKSAGAVLLAKALQLDCDLLVVGGYSRSKIREVVLGGVTGYLLGHADLPVLMVH